jgi:uncharacterized protein (DUF4415 family)
MGTIVSTIKAGQKPGKAEMVRIRKELREAKKHPIVYTGDCPESILEALKEFAHLAAERNRRKRKRSVTIRVAPDVLESYKTMGNGYTGIMADVLKYALDNPGILTAATK